MGQNLENMRKGYEAYAAADIDGAKENMHDDVVFVVPGRSALAGTYSGMDAVLGLFMKIFEMSGGTAKQELISLAEADNGDVLVCVREMAERNGRSFETTSMHRCTVVDGKLKRLEIFSNDMYEADAFWSDEITLPGQATAREASAKV